MEDENKAELTEHAKEIQDSINMLRNKLFGLNELKGTCAGYGDAEGAALIDGQLKTFREELKKIDKGLDREYGPPKEIFSA